MTTPKPFNRPNQLAYFSHSLRKLPAPYGKADTSRVTLVHFAVHALDLLGVWDSPETQDDLGLDKQAIIEWVYSLQVPADRDSAGFFGGSFLGGTSCACTTAAADPDDAPPANYSHGHIAMTYTALCTLTCLGDDWSRLDREGIIKELSRLQLPDGSFTCVQAGSENDLRFLYCACCISHMLNDWSGFDTERAVAYIQSCRSFDGAIALLPGQEGHGGSTFCGVASLRLMNQLNETIDADWRKDLLRWCVHRQVGGMQGRPNKDEDTCYSSWIGGTLRILGEDGLLDHKPLRAFVMRCQTPMGGFGKMINAFPDVFHSFYSLCYLSISQSYFEDDEEPLALKEFNSTLGICADRAAIFEPVYP